MGEARIVSAQPASQRAEESVVGALLRSADARMEVIGAGLEPQHFHYRPYRLAFEEVVERFYSDEPIDPLSIAEAVGPQAATAWKLDEREAIDRLTALATPNADDPLATSEHVKIVRRHYEYRELLRIASTAVNEAIEQDHAPEAIAGTLSAAATRIITGSMIRNELIGYSDLGRRWVRGQQQEIAAAAAGTEIGAVFSIKGVDEYVKGLRPTELMMLGGDPGVGKSCLAFAMGRNFAYRQMRKAADHRVATLILSLEMGEQQSSSRFAQMESGVDGEALRTGTLTRMQLREIAAKWAANREIPLVLNHSGELRESQIRALCVDAIRRHNVGLVIIDHFRFIKTDERFQSPVDADEQIVKFLKATLAKDLNLAVICLAHTTKGEAGRRPKMDDLRGSKMISAFADLVAFLYSPWRNASQQERERGLMGRTEYEVIFDKCRNSEEGTGQIFMDMSRMSVR